MFARFKRQDPSRSRARRRRSILREVPRPIWIALALLLAAAPVPFALIARARTMTSTKPRVQFVQDMGVQPVLKAQAYNPLFADRRAMRLPTQGTLPQDAQALRDQNPAFYRGITKDKNGAEQWLTDFPHQITVNPELIDRGGQRFGIFCAACHGQYGFGNGTVAERGKQLAPKTWVAPANLRGDTVKSQPNGYVFSVISNGARTMPGYASQIPVADRWAIIAYLRDLQSK